MLFLLLWAAAVAAAPVDSAPALFDPPMVIGPTARTAPPAIRAGIVTRSRPAAVKPDVLTGPDGARRLGIGQRIRLDLFDDASFTATITDVVDRGPVEHAWSGTQTMGALKRTTAPWSA